MANPMKKLTKDQFIPFLDTAEDKTYKASEWARIDLSTIFELAINPQSESMDYICYKNAVEEVMSNQPELPQEIALYEGNPLYDYMAEKLYNLPTGDECKVPFLLCFGGTTARAWRGICTLLLDNLSTTDGKLSFSMKMGGDIELGTYAITAGKPVFTPAAEAASTKKISMN